MQHILKAAADSLVDLFGKTAELYPPENGDPVTVTVSPLFKTSRKENSKDAGFVAETGNLLLRGPLSPSQLIPGKSRVVSNGVSWEIETLSRIGDEGDGEPVYEAGLRR